MRQDNMEAVYGFVVTYKSEHNGNSPSMDEIANACNLSKSTVSYFLDQLVKAGRLEKKGFKGITIPNSEWRLTEPE